ncbi:hypothetical protein AXX16_2337 [Serratia rubidaea]|nr:hypothetical protein AXX16_2337 [Serratia rubidaea]
MGLNARHAFRLSCFFILGGGGFPDGYRLARRDRSWINIIPTWTFSVQQEINFWQEISRTARHRVWKKVAPMVGNA